MQRDALFDLLARSPRGVSVVTSNRRLARSLAAEFDAYQAGHERTVWETPQILPYGAFVAKLYESARHEPELSGVRAPLTPAQERAMWQSVVSDSNLVLLWSSTAASLASEAWSLAHQWDIAPRVRRYRFGPDLRAFIGWCDQYQRRVDASGAADPAQLPDLVCKHLSNGAIFASPTIVLAGFSEATPQQQRLFDVLEASGSRCQHYIPAQHNALASRAECLDVRDENARMADWVAARLTENPQARIGVVVPDLASRRRAMSACLDAALMPGHLLAPEQARPYTMSLGGALADVPLIAFFLRSARVSLQRVEFEEASAMLRSPYLAGAADERDARDLLDAELRRRCERTVALDRLLEAAGQCARECGIDVPHLLHQLQTLQRFRRKAMTWMRKPSDWAEALAAMLQSIGAHAAADRTLDSNEYQALLRWQQLLGEFAELDRVLGRINADTAISQIESVARDVIFQPEGGAPPVQVLGVLEANALTFDHLWIMGMTADAWPNPPQPHPLLPIELQRAVGMPGADASADLQRAQQQLQRLLQSAPEVVVSHATIESDRPLAASGLITSLPAWTPVPRAKRLIDAMVPATLESFSDAVAPPWQPVAVLRGGASILRDQAACPFRAFAAHRLDAKAIESPHDGFDYRERGQLVHDVLARFWTSLPEPTLDVLVATPEEARLRLLSDAAAAALLRLQRRRGATSTALLELESVRLVRVIDQWLQYEAATRAAFRVAAVEEARTVSIGPLTFTARPDRIDQLPDGTRVVIDYKTGATKNTGWLEERPEEPQLPLYLIASETAARAIALARVRAGDVGFSGFAADTGMLPGRTNYWKGRYANWEALVDFWSTVLQRLATQFAAGEAAVSPKRPPPTCRYCDLPTLCRINERGAIVITGLPEDEDSAQWTDDED